MQHGRNFVERHRGKRCGVVVRPEGDIDLSAVQKTAAGVNDVGDVAFPLVFVGLDEWLSQVANDFVRVFTIEQEGADAIFPHWPHAMADDEATGFGLDR